MVTIQAVCYWETGSIAYNYVAYIHYGLGDMDKYFEYMNRALEAHMLISTWVM